ncbi:MAG: SAM-dependent chlorinase/fluorinase [Thermodesulfovibrio sp.]|nr:SAM-dependent chlorinase/fluorinase [Thermodesulfovibrio sp.]
MKRLITLTTDFGYKDPFVGQMKGVILSINPKAQIVDITHDIPSHSIEDAARVLWQSFRYFPKKTIHIVVVDPGVGSQRKALAVKALNHYFFAPNNGVLTPIFRKSIFKAYSIENEKYILKKDSPTFQGRDLFSAAAAWLSRGINIEELGPEIKEPLLISIDEAYTLGNKIIGKVVYIDKFGNAITNIEAPREKIKEVRFRDLRLPVVKCYEECKDSPAATVNSDGYIEIFVYMGNVTELLRIKKSEPVEVIINGSDS